MSPAAGPGPAATRRYGPAAGEPPLLADPRRWGSLIGLVGGMVFVANYSSVFGAVAAAIAWAAGVAGVLTALFAHYIRPVSLGPLARPRPHAFPAYCGCVVGQLALIVIGSRALTALGHGELRPALIATVVGLHFLPFAWAFRERMFRYLGCVVAGLGATGLLVGALGVSHAADALAVFAGLAMLIMVTLYALGRFVRPSAVAAVD